MVSAARRHRLSLGLLLLAATLALWAGPALLRPARTPEGTAPGPELSRTLPRVPLLPQRVTVLGYEREAFGAGWAAHPAGCSTREAVAQAQFGPGSVRGCRIVSAGTDPYSGEPLDPASVDIDHLYPLSAAWDMGAHAWSPQRRRRFANDPINLVAVSREQNREKSDQLPSRWLPPLPTSRCWYARRLAQVAAEYGLPLPRHDAAALRAQCRFRELPARSLG
ncbi:HNH endonuclease family protein [Corynebacterium mastitidis]|uniref:HNH endonuclease family protein n=1 Tax=Corynebacterium mastitidis TaxID=161890 RepID=UPI00036B405A|nr:HNH endonuclease family protein [Corynebacterium mastitidis]